MDEYYKIECPACKYINIVYLGDPSDLIFYLGNPGNLTEPNTEAVICWNCNHKWLLPGAEDWTDLENANTAKGKMGNKPIDSLRILVKEIEYCLQCHYISRKENIVGYFCTLSKICIPDISALSIPDWCLLEKVVK